MVPAYQIEGKVAVVTGGAQSLGLLTTQRLARLGARVVVGDIQAAGAAEVDKLNQELGADSCIFQQCDVSDSPSLHALIDLASTHYGRLDILVNNAGILDTPVYKDPTGKRARACIDINTRGLIDATNHALHVWQREDARGVVINMASIAAYAPMDCIPAYCASKAAVVSYTKALAGLAPTVRVNAVAPSWVDTKIIDGEHITRDHFSVRKVGVLQPSAVVDQIIRLIEDESLAGDVVILRNNMEPRLCTQPKSTDVMAYFE